MKSQIKMLIKNGSACTMKLRIIRLLYFHQTIDDIRGQSAELLFRFFAFDK